MIGAHRRIRFAKAGALALAAAALLLGAIAAFLHFGTAWKLRQLPRVPAGITVPTGGDAAEGARLAAIIGCTGCHGADMAGRRSCYEQPGRYRFHCPNVVEARTRYTDRDLVVLLRHGRKLDGALVDFMPWDMYAQLTEQDLANVIAFVRALPAVEKPVLPKTEYAWSTRLAILRGEYPYVNDLADYDTNPREGAAERGRYLASIACPECHAPDLNGYEGDSAPSLLIAKAYSAEAFATLMRTGRTLAGTDSATGLMSSVARWRFAHFTDEEIGALKAYLDLRE
ncbi:MAG TPA: cytochrome c [Steroidobacteraceae bacterium]|nr:cytochrome c [Steroidobacteraceae bacterium]